MRVKTNDIKTKTLSCFYVIFVFDWEWRVSIKWKFIFFFVHNKFHFRLIKIFFNDNRWVKFQRLQASWVLLNSSIPISKKKKRNEKRDDGSWWGLNESDQKEKVSSKKNSWKKVSILDLRDKKKSSSVSNLLGWSCFIDFPNFLFLYFQSFQSSPGYKQQKTQTSCTYKTNTT